MAGNSKPKVSKPKVFTAGYQLLSDFFADVDRVLKETEK